MEAYDPTTGVWSLYSPLNRATNNMGVVATASRLYVLGGDSDNRVEYTDITSALPTPTPGTPTNTFTPRPTPTAPPGTPASWADNFEDGVINTSLWAVGGDGIGVAFPSSGPFSWSHTEVLAADGYMDIRVQGPATGNTYGADAWLRSTYNFNDGADHVINFTWAAEVNAYHIDNYAIQITNGENLADGGYEWFLKDTVGTKNLYTAQHRNGQIVLAKTTWSILIDASGRQAQLYAGPYLTGGLRTSKALTASEHWYLRFIHADATSAGFPGSDNHLFLYDVSGYDVSTIPTPTPIAPDTLNVFVLDDYGAVHTGGAANAVALTGGPYFGWNIARGLQLVYGLPTGNPSHLGCLVLDGYGALHTFSSSRPPQNFYFQADVAADLAVFQQDLGGMPGNIGAFVLDRTGKLWACGEADPAVAQAGSFAPPVDGVVVHAVDIVLAAPSSGWIMDNFGGVHPFGGATSPNFPISTQSNWTRMVKVGDQLVRMDASGMLAWSGTPPEGYELPLVDGELMIDICVEPGYGFIALDRFGALHATSGAILPPPGSGPPYFGFPAARDLALGPPFAE